MAKFLLLGEFGRENWEFGSVPFPSWEQAHRLGVRPLQHPQGRLHPCIRRLALAQHCLGMVIPKPASVCP